MRCCHWIGSLSACTALVLPCVAAALELHWEATSGCPTQEDLAYRIERALGSPLAEAAAGQFGVRASRTSSGYEARLENTSARGATAKARLLRAADCDKLADMVALAIALALGAKEQVDATTPAATSSKTTAHTAPGASSARDLRVSDRGAREPGTSATSSAPNLGLGVWMIGDSGTQPRVAVTPSFGLQTSWRHVQLRASVALFAGQKVYESVTVTTGEFDPTPSQRTVQHARMDISVALANVVGCGAVWGAFNGKHALTLCGGGEVGNVHVRPITAINVARSKDTDSFWLAPSASAGGFIAVPSTRLRFGAALAAAVPVYRNNFGVADSNAHHRADAVALRASLGLDWVIW